MDTVAKYNHFTSTCPISLECERKREIEQRKLKERKKLPSIEDSSKFIFKIIPCFK